MRALLLGLVAILLAGCITGDQVREIAVGMTRAEVVEIMGAPDGVQANGSTEVLKYSNRLMSGWSWDRTDYYVTLTQGRVSSYGNGEVRQNAPPNFSGYVPPGGYSPSAPVPQQTYPRPAVVCMKTGEALTGATRQCAYNCLGSQVIQTVQSVQLCPLSINR